MKLFSTNQNTFPININPLKLTTPVGNITFECKVNNHFINPHLCSKLESTNPNNYLAIWTNKDYSINFLRTKFNPILPPGMEVDECFATVWRIKIFKNLNISLSCYLNSPLNSYAEPGECLIAQSFENELIKLSIGTEDEDSFKRRAEAKIWFPHRLEKEINASYIQYLNKGIRVELPLLFKEEEIQIHFLVAWSSKKDREITTWYAVEQAPLEILNQSGFY